MMKKKIFWLLILMGLMGTGCVQSDGVNAPIEPTQTTMEQIVITPDIEEDIRPTSQRPMYFPGELVSYLAQDGDTLINLSARFNTSIEEILKENPQIPHDVTTMPVGMPMEIPIYYLPFWGTQFQIIPNNQFVNGASAISFDSASFVSTKSTWLNELQTYMGGQSISGVEAIDYIAYNYSIHPKVLLTLLEYQAGVLSDSYYSDEEELFLLGFDNPLKAGYSSQLNQAAALLNEGYYLYQSGQLVEFDRPNGYIERPDPGQNAGTVALQYYFSILLEDDISYQIAIGPEGFAKTYQDLFGDPWLEVIPPVFATNVKQIEFKLPFEKGELWNFTGAPHSIWGKGEPFGALDFAPPLTGNAGCLATDRKVVAVADGVVARTDIGYLMLDLDGDGDERTGWNVLYFHIATNGKAPVGTIVKKGDPLGYPSCEGGTSTGTHIHVARKYNGEWINATGAIPFIMENWIPNKNSTAYKGTMTRFGLTITASETGGARSQILSRE